MYCTDPSSQVSMESAQSHTYTDETVLSQSPSSSSRSRSSEPTYSSGSETSCSSAADVDGIPMSCTDESRDEDSMSEDLEEASTSSTDDNSSAAEDSHDLSATEKACTGLKEFSTPLYPNAEITVLDSYLLLYDFALRHCLTKQAFTDLIKLVSVHLPAQQSQGATSFHNIQSFFQKNFNKQATEVHSYCSLCHSLTGDSVSHCEGAVLKQFLYVPVDDQLRRMIEGM